MTTQHRHQKTTDYTTIADRFRTVSWGNDSHPTGVVKPVYGIPTFPLTATAMLSKGRTLKKYLSCKCRRRLSVLVASLKSDVLHLYILCRVKSNEGIRTTWITSIKSNTKVIHTKYHGIHKNSFMIPCKDLLANRLFKSVLKINYSNYE